MKKMQFNNMIIFHEGLLIIIRPVVVFLIFTLSLMPSGIISCKKMLDVVEAEPDVSELTMVQSQGRNLPADIDISDLLAIWTKTVPTKDAPQFQDPYEAAPRIVHEFSRAGKTGSFSSGGTQVWFGIGFSIPAMGKATQGWYIIRIETPLDFIDKSAIENLKEIKLIDERAISSSVVFHCEYRSSDWDFVKMIVEGRPLPDEHPFMKDLRTMRGGGSYPLVSTAGTSSVVIHDKPFVEPEIRNYVPLYLRQRGNRMYGIQRTKTGNSQLPFEHITGIYYQFWRVR